MSNKTLAEVRALPVDSKFQSVGLVTELKEKRDKNDKPYWIMSVMDKSGVLDAKVWGNAQWFDLKDGVKKEIGDPASSPLVQNLKGETAGLIGSITEFKGKPQYQFNQIWLVDQEREEYRPAAFIRAAGVPADRLEAEFWQLVNGCGGEAGEFLRFVFRPNSETWQAFKIFPAAVAHHHAYLHGLSPRATRAPRTSPTSTSSSPERCCTTSASSTPTRSIPAPNRRWKARCSTTSPPATRASSGWRTSSSSRR